MSIRHIKQSEKNLVVEYLKNLKYIYQTWLWLILKVKILPR
jgi:hypothetical protein